MSERSIRCLSGLQGAASSRVLNLIAIAEANVENPGHKKAPLFLSRALNESLILKHRLRADEVGLFANPRAVATKIIIPFERTDLRFGGRSLFVEENRFQQLLTEFGNYKDITDMKRDLYVLKLIDSLPSLDPFLLREHLRCNEVFPDSSYFAISVADQKRMHHYATSEIGRLTALASGSSRYSAATGRMVTALLSNEVTERLEPLRATLCLDAEDFAEGVFSWRGFIYYKWSLEEYWPHLIRALRGIKEIVPTGKVTSDERAFLAAQKKIILQGARNKSAEVRRIISMYDEAYAKVIERHDPTLFRAFLLGARNLFLEIGDKMGSLSHITSFWNYRFPQGAPRSAQAEELLTVFQDFTKGLSLETDLAA